MDRRNFIARTGAALSTAIALPALGHGTLSLPHSTTMPGTWAAVREQFNLSHSHIQMSQMLFASHPAPVRKAIQDYTDSFDRDPALFWENNWRTAEDRVTDAANKYTGAAPGEIALTDSTTQGLGLLYTGLKLRAGDEILTTTHDHYSTETSLDYACRQTGARIRRIDEYKDPATASVQEITENIANSI